MGCAFRRPGSGLIPARAQLAPEYAKAAKSLKAMDPPLRIAKVDATAEQELGDRFEVRGFPTIKVRARASCWHATPQHRARGRTTAHRPPCAQFFRNGHPSEYDGGRTASDIVNFMKKKSGPPTTNVDTVAALEQLLSSNDVVVLGYFQDLTSSAFKVRPRSPALGARARARAAGADTRVSPRQAFETAASGVDDVVFATSDDSEVAQKVCARTFAPRVAPAC